MYKSKLIIKTFAVSMLAISLLIVQTGGTKNTAEAGLFNDAVVLNDTLGSATCTALGGTVTTASGVSTCGQFANGTNITNNKLIFINHDWVLDGGGAGCTNGRCLTITASAKGSSLIQTSSIETHWWTRTYDPTNRATVKNVNIDGGGLRGVCVQAGSFAQIENNNIENCVHVGIVINKDSSNTKIIDNIISNLPANSTGIRVKNGSISIELGSNNISGVGIGIEVIKSTSTYIHDNTSSNNDDYGIFFEDNNPENATSHTLTGVITTGNTFQNNSADDIYGTELNDTPFIESNENTYGTLAVSTFFPNSLYQTAVPEFSKITYLIVLLVSVALIILFRPKKYRRQES